MPTTNFIWDEQNYLAESDGSNTITVVYTNAPHQYGSLASSRLSGTTSYHEFDAIGSTCQLTNSAGIITDTLLYDVWGNVVARVGATAIALLWNGEVGYYADLETGFYVIRERTLVPSHGRWTACDSSGFLDGLNRYLYVHNCPSNKHDPSGRQSVEELIEGVQEKLKDMNVNACKRYCADWVKKQKRNDKWLSTLPDCPCFTCEVASDSDKWSSLEKADLLHPGAEECTRSNVTATLTDWFPPGQQCCYKGGRLITKGPGAGTPDRYAPGSGLLAPGAHFDNDVFPFLACQKAGMTNDYLEARPPNDGGKNKCDEFEPKP